MCSNQTDSGMYAIGNYDTIGPLHDWGGGIFRDSRFDKVPEEYFSTGNLPHWYGPSKGENWAHFRRPESKNELHEAVAIHEEDSILIYVDGKLIKKIDTLCRAYISKESGKPVNELFFKKSHYSSNSWATLSDNGNVIYALEENYKSTLYVNHKAIDLSDISFNHSMINNAGEYIYYRAAMVGEGDSAECHRYVHVKDTIIGPITERLTVEGIMNDGGYYYLDGETFNNFILINNEIHTDTIYCEVEKIIIPNDKDYFCLKKREDQWIVHANGITHELDYKEVFSPSMDENGNFAMFVIEDYYLYRWLNGVREKKPIMNYGVRPIPLYIHPNGDAIILYVKEDSCYLYRNDELLFSTLKGEIRASDLNSMLGRFKNNDIHKNQHDYIYLEVKDSAYILTDGVFSEAISHIAPITGYGMKEVFPSQLVHGRVQEKGFHFIKKEEDKRYSITINNDFHGSIENVSRVFANSFFDGKKLVFYGIKELSLYQFTVEL